MQSVTAIYNQSHIYKCKIYTVNINCKIFRFFDSKFLVSVFDFLGVPLSSTHQFHTKEPLLSAPKIPQLHTKNPSVQHTPQLHTRNPSVPHQKFLSSYLSVPHQIPLSSTPKIPQFHTKNPSVPHQKFLSSTLSVQHRNPSVQHTPQFHTKTPQFNTPELRDFWCGTEGFSMWN